MTINIILLTSYFIIFILIILLYLIYFNIYKSLKNNNHLNDNYLRENRIELTQSIKSFEDSMLKRISENSFLFEQKLENIRKDNNYQLEKIREIVENKLHHTLDNKLGISFKLVSDKLELVQQGLNEMQTLAIGVGDLKKILSNVKTKGILGEYQLSKILEDLLPSNQYEKNFQPQKNSKEKVEFAIKIPSKQGDITYLPIDAKLPTEDYTSLLDAYDSANTSKIQEQTKKLENTIKKCAKDIKEKYINPPYTTDFALMFLPFEGLYAEVLKINGLFENTQREYKVIITGPTTLSAFLNSLQIGFKTFAVEQRSNEVWHLLSSIKKEMYNFVEILEKTEKKLNEATNIISDANKKTRIIQNQLKNVEINNE